MTQIEITPVFCEGEVPEKESEYQQHKIYIAAGINTLALKCLCGCGDIIKIPVNQHPDGWQLSVDHSKKITLDGSIRHQPCNAHYVITDNIAHID